ncbi:MAG: sporulation protein YunB [Halanaerobiales bacterium]
MLFVRRHPLLFRIIVFVGLLMIVFLLILHNSLLPVFIRQAEVEAVRIINRAVSEAVDRETEDLEYRDLIYYEKDDSEKIVMMQPNVREINRFSSDVSLTIQERLEKIEKTEVRVPLFRVLGLDFLASYGPDLPARVIPAGFVEPPEVVDNFESAGINQTRHKIYLDVNVAVNLVVPFTKKTTEVSSVMPLIEVTIVGDVPDVYVGIEGNDFSGIIGDSSN